MTTLAVTAQTPTAYRDARATLVRRSAPRGQISDATLGLDAQNPTPIVERRNSTYCWRRKPWPLDASIGWEAGVGRTAGTSRIAGVQGRQGGLGAPEPMFRWGTGADHVDGGRVPRAERLDYSDGIMALVHVPDAQEALLRACRTVLAIQERMTTASPSCASEVARQLLFHGLRDAWGKKPRSPCFCNWMLCPGGWRMVWASRRSRTLWRVLD